MTKNGELDPHIRDLIDWIGDGAKPYAEVMEAWRTSCPRLTVWEDAVERGFVARRFDPETGATITVTDAGKRFASKLRRCRGADW